MAEKASEAGAPPQSPTLQELIEAVDRARREKDEIISRCQTESRLHDRFHEARHDCYLLEVKYRLHEKEEAHKRAVRRLRDVYPAVVDLASEEFGL